MATVVRKASFHYPDDYTVIVTWDALDSDDEGDDIILPEHTDRCVQVTGTFGAGGSVRIAGTNNPGAGATYHALSDPAAAALNITAAGIKQITEVPHKLKPIVTAGDGTTLLTVRMICRRKRTH